jgi:hypothetical protein
MIFFYSCRHLDLKSLIINLCGSPRGLQNVSKTLRKPSLFISSALIMGVGALAPQSIAQIPPPDLRSNLKIQQSTNNTKVKQDKAAQCIAIEQQFRSLDLYQSADGSKVFGVDLRGNIWTVRDSLGMCTLNKISKLDKPDYTLDREGARSWVTFHYEDNRLCRYIKGPQSEKVTQTCFKPVGIVSRYAPYFLN